MKYRPLELRMKLYDEVHSLRNLGLSYSQIIKMIQEKYGERLTITHISRWLRGIHSPCGRELIMLDDVKPSRELATIIGTRAGDGYTYIIEKEHKYVVGLKCKDADYALEFARCLEVVTGSKPYIGKQKDGLYVVEGYSKTLYELLKKPLDIKKLRYYIEYNVETMTAFLRAFFDSEGCVDKNEKILVYNTDLDLLNYVKQLLLKLNIEVTGPHLIAKKGAPIYDRKKGKTYYRKEDVYYLYIRVNSRRRFAELVGFTIKRKMERLMKALNLSHHSFSFLSILKCLTPCSEIVPRYITSPSLERYTADLSSRKILPGLLLKR